MMNKVVQSALMFITVLMSATGKEQVMYAKAGEKVILTCPASSQYVNWYYNDKSQHLAWINPLGGKGSNNDAFSLSGSSLVINNIQQFGTFFYEESNSNNAIIHSKTYKLFQITVNKKPESLLLPGETLSLQCDVTAEQKPYIYWLSPQGQQKTGHRLNIKATSSDNGQWNCAVGDQRFPISVDVVGFSPAPARQYTSVNALTVPCSLPGHISWKQIKEKGVTEVQWHFTPKSSPSGTQELLFSLSLEDPLTWRTVKGNGLQPATDPSQGDLSLTKRQWKEADRGNYTCSMKFKNDVTLSTTVQVEVLQISAFPGTELIIGQKINLSCSTGDLLPTGLQLKWIPPEKSSLKRCDHHCAHSLIIPEVGTDDKGRWRCELWQNTTLLTSAAIMLKIEPLLSVWMLVIICGAGVILILLLVVAFILCRRRQRKTRHLRQKLCRCKNPKPKGFYRT